VAYGQAERDFSEEELRAVRATIHWSVAKIWVQGADFRMREATIKSIEENIHRNVENRKSNVVNVNSGLTKIGIRRPNQAPGK